MDAEPFVGVADVLTVAYLGPRGSFAEAAVLAWPG